MSDVILPGNPPIPLTLRRSARARRISLRVSQLDGRVTLTLPKRLPQEEALAFADGDLAGAKVHEVSVAEVDVAEVRQRTGLSQAEFAKSIGVAKGTLLNWEHGRRHPTGSAQVLLALIAKKPSVVQDLLRGA